MSGSIRSLALDELEGGEGIQAYATCVALEPLIQFSVNARTSAKQYFSQLSLSKREVGKEIITVKGKITVSF